MNIPPYLTPHRATVEPKLGDSAVGPRFGPPIVDCRCFYKDERKQTTSADGTRAVSTGVAVFPLNDPLDDIPVGSRVTFNGAARTVLSSSRNVLNSLTPNHIEVRLQ